ncbi:MAG: InlB B-repeat-containing protein [Eubacteriales bacterium]|nr:InlB B-repeat-containing protein [Eubacteriales bacterium]MCI6941960.1 InlB B-repeat-containing protein [Christensenellaceae bacterium]
MNKTKRVLSVILAVLMLSSLIAALAIADGQHTVVINYVFENGKQAAPSWTATLAEGSNLEQTVTSPTVVGYAPDQPSVDVFVNNITENKTYTVTYYPANVGFTVNHYLQNVADNNYTLNVSERHDGFTESEVGDGLAETYPGFAALLYNTKAKVAADGSTVVEIYYDRNYYMMSFNLDGGYGVEPIYARYGASVKVENPTKPGYTFNGWEPQVPATVLAENTTYTAKWTPGESGFTVVFWYGNANDDGYSYAGSTKPANVAPGTQKSSGDYKDAAFTGRDDTHFTYNTAKVETVTVKGDGSTVLNVYFTRNKYTLTFKNAVLSCGKVEHSHSHDQCCTKKDVHLLGTIFSPCNTDKCPYGYEHSHSSSCYKDLTITAKYGADIHNNFPIKDGDKTIWWIVPDNTETYGKLTEQTYLGSIDTMPGENITFTKNDSESGAKIYYYVETINGAAGDTAYKGRNYKQYKVIDLDYSESTSLTYREEFHPITGFTQGESNPYLPKDGKVEMQQNNYLYYTRNSYKLKFFNYNGFVADKEQNVQYEAPLEGKDFTPAYPADLEANAYEFAGWYTTEGCFDGSEVKWDTAKMPAGDVVLYAKWAPKTHTVKTFLTKEKIEENDPIDTWDNVPHGTAVTNTPADPKNGSYVFVGWFYMDGNVEKAFDFSMPVVKDLNLYAKWSSNTLVTYTIYYKSGDTEIAEPTTGSALAGTTLTFEAKTGDELNKDYQSGYFPHTGSHSLTMDINGNNEFTFVYVAKEKVGYTVRYLDKATGEPVVVNGVPTPDKTGETSDAIITEKFKVITGYMPDSYQKRLVLSADPEKNVITFWYTKDEHHATIQKNYWIQNVDGNGYSSMPYSEISAVGNIGTTYSADVITITGFTYNPNPANAHTEHPALASGELTAEGLELNMYYDRVKYSYTVRYVDATDNNKDIDPAANVTGEGLFGAQVIGSQKKFNGYMPADNEPKQKSIIIGTGTNEIIFYYYPCYYIGHVRSGGLNNTDTIRLTGSKANLTAAVTTGYLYGGTFDNVDCTTVHDFGEENAINFTPVKGETYYIWEVSETYLKPRAYVVSRHDPDNNGGYNVVGLYLTSSVDRNMYSEVGFTVDGTNFASDGGKVYDKVQAVYTDNKEVKEEMYVDSTGVWKVQKEADSSHGGYVSICTVSMNYFYDKNAASPLSYQPYWVTLDGIKVTGAYEARTCYYQGVGYNDVWISDCVSSNSRVSIYRAATTNTIGVESVAVLSAAPETVQPEVPVTPEIPEVPEAPEMTLNSDAMYLRAQYTYEMMTNTVRFISAIDVNECTEYGFVINGEVVKCEEAAETVDGYDANYLFGGSVNGAMLMSCNMLLDGLVDGMTLNVTPYYVALDGTTVVYGETRTLVYRQWVGLEG